MNTLPSSSERLYFIDWVRVFAFGLLILFHCTMSFVDFGWEIKNDERSILLTRLIWWLHQWRLPLLFFIAGVGSYFSLEKRTSLSFLSERFVRLFIPLWFAILFTIPIQVYFERMQRGQIDMTYFEFYPTVWNFIPYPEGNLTWSHLWFVTYLFVFTILLLPIFLILRIKIVEQWKQYLDRIIASPVVVLVLCALLIFYYFKLYLRWPEQGSLVDDWFVFLFSMTLFFFGYFLASLPSLWQTCEVYRWYFLTLAFVCIIWLYIQFWWSLQFPKTQDRSLYTYGVLNSIHIWSIILAILGFARKHLNFSNWFLRYTTPAVYPFYILHQTIIVATGYYVVQWSLPLFAKLLILILICLSSVGVLYHVVIKNFAVTRVLYGLKLKR
ncbi:MAG: acyltransferase family protein [Bacteroidota bacterium]